MNVIEAKNLKKVFAGMAAVDDFSFEVREGEIFGIIGPDGAGKTTLLRMLGGVMLPSSGTLKVLDRELPGEAEKIRSRIGYLSQKFSLYHDLTVAENIRFFGKLFNLDRKILDERSKYFLEMTNLTKFTERLAANLSGGMRQKLALICTLLHKPDLLLLDEPTAGVDPVSRKEFWEILYKMACDGVSVVITTPYMDEAEMCGRVGLMFKGGLMLCDTPKHLKKTISGVIVEVYPKQRSEEIDSALRNFDGVTDIQLTGNKYRMIMKDWTRVNKLTEKFSLAAEIKPVKPSIEDIFMSRLTQIL